MHGAYQVQRAICVRQERRIRTLLRPAGRDFQAYRRRYLQSTRAPTEPASNVVVNRRIHQADVVLVGDYHTQRLAQEGYLDIARRARGQSRSLILALEFVPGDRQVELDAYLRGKLSADSFVRRIRYPKSAELETWPSYQRILEFARLSCTPVIGLDARGRSLAARDAYAADRIAGAAYRKDRPRVFVLAGQFHVAPPHLPAAIRRTPKGRHLTQLTVYQNAEAVYWRYLRTSRELPTWVEVGASALNKMHSTPLRAQRSFLQYVSTPSGDEATPIVEALGRFLRLSPRRIRAACESIPVISRRGDALEGSSVRRAAIAAAQALIRTSRLGERPAALGRDFKAIVQCLVDPPRRTPVGMMPWFRAQRLRGALDDHSVRLAGIRSERIEWRFG